LAARFDYFGYPRLASLTKAEPQSADIKFIHVAILSFLSHRSEKSQKPRNLAMFTLPEYSSPVLQAFEARSL